MCAGSMCGANCSIAIPSLCLLIMEIRLNSRRNIHDETDQEEDDDDDGDYDDDDDTF